MMNLIIPCYNENLRGYGDKSFRNRLEQLECLVSYPIDLVFVDDGSTDDTFDVIQKCFGNTCTIVRSHVNQGKGASILTGIHICNPNNYYTCYLDADMSVNPFRVVDVYNFLSSHLIGDYFLYGSRFSEASEIASKRGVARTALSDMARVFLNQHFNLRVSDTQCGFKVFPTNLAKENADLLYPSRWLFDIELICLARLHHLIVQSVPVYWDNMESESSVNIVRDVKLSLKDLDYVDMAVRALRERAPL